MFEIWRKFPSSGFGQNHVTGIPVMLIRKHVKHWGNVLFFVLNLLENVDTEEAKVFMEANYSHVYHIFYDNFIVAENNLKQKGKFFIHFK